jgi:hypothetical protein
VTQREHIKQQIDAPILTCKNKNIAFKCFVRSKKFASVGRMKDVPISWGGLSPTKPYALRLYRNTLSSLEQILRPKSKILALLVSAGR